MLWTTHNTTSDLISQCSDLRGDMRKQNEICNVTNLPLSIELEVACMEVKQCNIVGNIASYFISRFKCFVEWYAYFKNPYIGIDTHGFVFSSMS